MPTELYSYEAIAGTLLGLGIGAVKRRPVAGLLVGYGVGVTAAFVLGEYLIASMLKNAIAKKGEKLPVRRNYVETEPLLIDPFDFGTKTLVTVGD